ncbi:MAG: methyltransferase domain-containing protein [bacterium]
MPPGPGHASPHPRGSARAADGAEPRRRGRRHRATAQSALTDWSRVARFYDRQLFLERPALRAMLELVAISPSDRLLDVGTGTGGALRQLPGCPARPARALGVDSSEQMLARARAALPRAIELATADARDLPFADEGFEVVTCAYLLHLLDPRSRASALGELYRVLAPGGRLGVVTVAPPATRLSRLASRPLRAIAARSTGVLAGLTPLDPSDQISLAGFTLEASRRVGGVGYPSLCLLANKRR